METQNTGLQADESPAFIDETDVHHPVDNETEQLRQDLEAERDKYLRLAAEFENYRRRTKKEQAEAAEKGKRDLLERIISLADDFKLASASLESSSGEKIVEGLNLIEQRLKSVLEANEVVAFSSVGEIFDPQIHEAFDIVPGAEGESGKVYSELRGGYFWRGKLLRPALVVVVQ